MVEDGGRGKLRDAREVIIVQIVKRVKAAAPQERVLDARGHQLAETHLQIEVVQTVQQASLGVVCEIAQMVAVDFAHGVVRQVHELTGHAGFLGGAVAPLQSGDDGGVVFLAQLPQPRLPRALHGAGVRNVKNIFQTRPAATAFPNQRDAGRAGAHPAPHRAVPQLHTGAGCGVGTLGVDQELFIKGVFVEAGGRVKILFPATGALRHFTGFLSCQLRYQP